MTDGTPPTPYLHFPGTARQALDFYCAVFGGSVVVNTFSEFGRTDGPAEAVAHGHLRDGPVRLYAADTAGGQAPVHAEGLLLALLGTADAGTLTRWFARLADGGRVVDDLTVRPWGAADGQVIDRFGLHWLIGFEDAGAT